MPFSRQNDENMKRVRCEIMCSSGHVRFVREALSLRRHFGVAWDGYIHTHAHTTLLITVGSAALLGESGRYHDEP